MPGNLCISINTMALMNCTPVPCCSNLEVKRAAIKFSKKKQGNQKKGGCELPVFLITELSFNTKAKELNKMCRREVNDTEWGCLMKRLNRLQLWDSHLTHKMLQENNKVGVWGEKTELKELLFTLLWWSTQQKYAPKLLFQKTQDCTKKLSPTWIIYFILNYITAVKSCSAFQKGNL